mgnify:CR=1 FL=1
MMTDWKKTTDDLTKVLNETAGKVAKFVNEGAKTIGTMAQQQRQRLELKAEIGEHTRVLNKTYARLGQAYYEAQETGCPLEGADDLMKLICSTKKLISMLNEKLDTLKADDSGKETDTSGKEDEKAKANETDDASEIHID